MFDVNIKIAKTTQNSWNFEYCEKVVYWNEEVANFEDYPGDFKL